MDIIGAEDLLARSFIVGWEVHELAIVLSALDGVADDYQCRGRGVDHRWWAVCPRWLNLIQRTDVALR